MVQLWSFYMVRPIGRGKLGGQIGSHAAPGTGKGKNKPLGIRPRKFWEGERPREPKHLRIALEIRAREDAFPPEVGSSDRRLGGPPRIH